MALSSDLISQFVQVTKEEKQSKETTVYGTIVEYDGGKYVKLDGSELLTPISVTADALDGERVTVMIKNHTATVTGNLSSPSARTGTVKDINDNVSELGSKISEFEIIIADKVSVGRLEAEIARIDTLVSENVVIKGRLDAAEADIGTLVADNVTINEKLTAAEAEIDKLEVNKLDASVAEITYATIENLQATNAEIANLEATYGEFQEITTDRLTAVEADIDHLEVTKLDVAEAEIKYANIDFSNIDMAAIEELFVKSGIIKDLVIDNGTITGELVGVTIKGDLIEGGTIVADKLVVKGEDGLYYKLNTDGMTTTAEQTDYNSLSGTVIQAKSITAEKIAVEDLVAFGATIGGFHITDDSLYSGVKVGPLNTTRGVYMDNDGQFSIGDSTNFFRYFKDSNGEYKLELSASSLKFTTTGNSVQDEIDGLRNELSTVLHIESSQGTMLDSSTTSTVLSVIIHRGSQRITDMTTLKSVMGEHVYLEWSSKGVNDTAFETISSSDTRIGNEGFTLTLSQNDIGAKTTYACCLLGPTTSAGTGSSGGSDTPITTAVSLLSSDGYVLKDSNGVYLTAKTTTTESGDSSLAHLEARITVAETSISQNSASITLCATKEEMQHVEGLANTAQETATNAESLIKQLADNISMLVTDGNGTSLMTQTDDGWVFSTLELQNAIDNTSEGLVDLVNELGSTTNTVEVLQQAVNDLGALSDYIVIGTYEGEPCIELGETDSEFKLRITNTKVVYSEGSAVLAYFTNQSMYIKNAVIEEELHQGGFVWKVRSNGNMGLVWKGASS